MFGFDTGAKDYLDKVPDMLRGYLGPYVNRGNQAGEAYSGLVNPMASDPTGYLEKLMRGYQPSQGFNLKNQAGLRSAANTAAAGGMRGSAMDQETQAKITQGLMSEDMQEWLRNVMGIQNTGLGGLHNLNQMGFEGARDLSEGMGNYYNTQAGRSMHNDAQMQQFLEALMGGALSAGGFGGMF